MSKIIVHNLKATDVLTENERKIIYERTNLWTFKQTKWSTGSGIRAGYTLNEAIDILSFCNERNMLIIWVRKNDRFLRAKVKYIKQNGEQIFVYLYKHNMENARWRYADSSGGIDK